MIMENDQLNPESLDTQLIFEWEPVEYTPFNDKLPMPNWQFQELANYYVQRHIAKELDKVEWSANYGYDIYSKDTTLRTDEDSEDSKEAN